MVKDVLNAFLKMTIPSPAAIEAMVSVTMRQTAGEGGLVILTEAPPAAVEAPVAPDFDQQLLAEAWSHRPSLRQLK